MSCHVMSYHIISKQIIYRPFYLSVYICIILSIYAGARVPILYVFECLSNTPLNRLTCLTCHNPCWRLHLAKAWKAVKGLSVTCPATNATDICRSLALRSSLARAPVWFCIVSNCWRRGYFSIPPVRRQLDDHTTTHKMKSSSSKLPSKKDM